MAADLLSDPNNLLRSSSLYHMGKPLVSAIAASADFSIPNDSINQIKTDLVGTYTIWVVLIAAYIHHRLFPLIIDTPRCSILQNKRCFL